MANKRSGKNNPAKNSSIKKSPAHDSSTRSRAGAGSGNRRNEASAGGRTGYKSGSGYKAAPASRAPGPGTRPGDRADAAGSGPDAASVPEARTGARVRTATRVSPDAGGAEAKSGYKGKPARGGRAHAAPASRAPAPRPNSPFSVRAGRSPSSPHSFRPDASPDAAEGTRRQAGARPDAAGPSGPGKKDARRKTKKQQRKRVRQPARERLLGREQVLRQLQTVNRPLEVDELSRQLEQADPGELLQVLQELERAGEVVRTRKNRYGVAKKMNLSVGLLQGHPKGFAFLVPDDKSDDIYITKENLGGAMHGDKVVVRPLAASLRGKRIEGEVIRVLERANERVVGRFEQTPTGGRGSQFGFVVPDEKRLGWDIFVPRNHQKGARHGDKVVVEITRWPEARRNPEGRIVEAFGAAGEPGVDILSIIKKYGLPEEFPSRVLREAEAIPLEVAPEDEAGRWDLRELPMVTIDGEDAKDLDDAVSLEVLGSGDYRLGVHIADVAYYVREGSELDKEAFERGTSVYLVDRVIPMLPEWLSNGICSLNAGTDRLSLSVFMEINGEGHVVRYEIGPSVIRVDERMTYTNVRRILDERDELLCQRYTDFVETFGRMRDLCLILRRRRHRRGALDFDFPECKVQLDEAGRPQDVCLLEQSIANQIIEEFMLMANETVAKHLYYLDVPLLYRVHEEPKDEKLTALNDFLHGFGYHIPVSGGVHPRFFQDVLHQVEGKPEQLVVHTVMLRSLQHARYAPAPLGHFGLAVHLYTHFTSPIRRYPDLIVHRVLREIIAPAARAGTRGAAGGSRKRGATAGRLQELTAAHPQELTAERREELELQMPVNAAQVSRREQVAEEAERETVDLKKVEYIRQFLGEIFDGFVSSVTNFGMFVALPNGIEGLVHVSSMSDDYYLFDDRNYTLTGEHTRKAFKIGDRVRVQLVRASLDDRQIDFELVSKVEQGLD
jgi:ribonuclease R